MTRTKPVSTLPEYLTEVLRVSRRSSVVPSRQVGRLWCGGSVPDRRTPCAWTHHAIMAPRCLGRRLSSSASGVNDVHRYPDANAFRLRVRIAAEHGVPTADIIQGNGSNELLALAVRTSARASTTSCSRSRRSWFTAFPRWPRRPVHGGTGA